MVHISTCQGSPIWGYNMLGSLLTKLSTMPRRSTLLTDPSTWQVAGAAGWAGQGLKRRRIATLGSAMGIPAADVYLGGSTWIICHICTYIYIYVDICIFMLWYGMCICMCLSVCIYVRMSVCMSVYVCRCMPCLYVCLYVCMHACFPPQKKNTWVFAL